MAGCVGTVVVGVAVGIVCLSGESWWCWGVRVRCDGVR